MSGNSFTFTMDYTQILYSIWSAILLPLIIFIGKKIYDYFQGKQEDKYYKLLYQEVTKVVRSVYEEYVRSIKGTDEWTIDKQMEVKQIAKKRIIIAMPTKGIKVLRNSNNDFNTYLDSLIESAIYDSKLEARINENLYDWE